ncbi:MAG: SnoaL-like domain-containing protein [Rhodospirillaceae bacterium]|jgi:ketosteroid isomerase-like protein|nr:SnoaL-like domain-containing protein [Rhodospirillaceae bacterium]MBT4490519.1 SnoaL-like domain-containing protein [Rhodospirillaceae bacterium]MBT5194207.1 SnoaL-like domain-containing protein [Rhodospirillaceae bacterium]MBT5894266.1 SnoaL-like domain-containing protein [Rhodospirillaceae bacterium]MBT6427060.1 SnoaL-like domain-containing protein [Rhodospirillaceae bacterium]
MTDEEMLELMKRFRRGYAKADQEGLAAATTDDFEWHMHYGEPGTDSPTGRVVKGVDGVMKEIAWREANWKNVTYENMVERPAGDVILQMFTTKGTDEHGTDYHLNVVDVYPVRDGRIYRKDTYWKGVK